MAWIPAQTGSSSPMAPASRRKWGSALLYFGQDSLVNYSVPLSGPTVDVFSPMILAISPILYGPGPSVAIARHAGQPFATANFIQASLTKDRGQFDPKKLADIDANLLEIESRPEAVMERLSAIQKPAEEVSPG